MLKKYFYIFFITIASSLLLTELTTGKTMSVLHNQPLFKIHVDTYGTKHIININGVSVITDLDQTGQSESTLPINHLMRSGLNTIEIYIS